jgi:ABC-type transport system substrate-binding protein
VRGRAGLLLAAAASVVACAPERQATPSHTLRIGLADALGGTDLLAARWASDLVVGGALFATLTRVDAEGHVLPNLAQRWSSPDGRRWTFVLRADARFHDGSRVTAAAVAQALARRLSLPPGALARPGLLDAIDGAARGAGAQLSGLRAVDDSTLVVQLVETHSELPTELTNPVLGIEGPAHRSDAPVGSGPWRFVRREPGDSALVLARAAGHWRAAGFDTLRFVVSGQDPAADLAAGRVDCVPYISEPQHARYVLTPSLAIHRTRPWSLVTMAVVAPPGHPLHQPLVRRAAQLALDGAQLAAEIATPGSRPAGSRVPEALGGYRPTLATYPFAPDSARRLLERAGYRGEEIVIGRVASLGDSIRPLERAVHDYLSAVGFRVRHARRDELSSPNGPLRGDLLMLSHLPDVPDAATFLASAYSAAGGSLPNWMPDAELQAALDGALRGATGGPRNAAIARADSLLYVRSPDLLLWWEPALTVFAGDRLQACAVDVFVTDFADLRPAP